MLNFIFVLLILLCGLAGYLLWRFQSQSPEAIMLKALEEKHREMIVGLNDSLNKLTDRLNVTLSEQGKIQGEISLKRQYRIRRGKMEFMLESSMNIFDDILQKELSVASDEKMQNIVATMMMRLVSHTHTTVRRTLVLHDQRSQKPASNMACSMHS